MLLTSKPRFALYSAAACFVGFSAFAKDQNTFEIGNLTLSNIAASATLPNAPVAAAYMSIRNDGETAAVLTGGAAEFAKKTEIHEMKMDGEVMRMRQINGGLTIPAGETVTLKPGGLHVMFMGMTQSLDAGNTANFRLDFGDAGSLSVSAPIKSRKAFMAKRKENAMKKAGSGTKAMNNKAGSGTKTNKAGSGTKSY